MRSARKKTSKFNQHCFENVIGQKTLFSRLSRERRAHFKAKHRKVERLLVITDIYFSVSKYALFKIYLWS